MQCLATSLHISIKCNVYYARIWTSWTDYNLSTMHIIPVSRYYLFLVVSKYYLCFVTFEYYLCLVVSKYCLCYCLQILALYCCLQILPLSCHLRSLQCVSGPTGEPASDQANQRSRAPERVRLVVLTDEEKIFR